MRQEMSQGVNHVGTRLSLEYITFDCLDNIEPVKGILIRVLV